MNERKKQKLFHFAVDLFIDLLQQVTKRKNIPYRCNNADQKSWDFFIEEYDNIGEEFVRSFIQFGIQSWFNSDSPKDYNRTIRFSWVVGKGAIKRWNTLKPSSCIWCVRKGLKTVNKINTLKNISQMKNILLKVRQSEEIFKSEYFNTKRGFLWCIANTSLYLHKSKYCSICSFKKECKEILKQEYPKVYKIRKYDK